MKRIHLTVTARIALLCIVLAAVFGHETFRGILHVSKGSETVVPSGLTVSGTKKQISIGIPGSDCALAALVANGGYRQAVNSWYAKNDLMIKISHTEDPSELIRGFAGGRYDVIAISPDSLAALYPSFASLSPVAFLQSGSSTGHIVIASKEKVAAIASLKKKQIACVEKSPAHFLLLYLLRENGIHPKDIRWIFTLTGDDAVRMAEEGKADVIAVQKSFIRRHIPSSMAVVFSTESALGFDRYVLIARESDIVTRPSCYDILVKGAFEARKTLLSMKDADAAALVKTYGAALPDGMLNPASMIPSLDDNLEFFRMSEKRTWDYICAYQSARELYSIPAESEGFDISSTQNLLLLDALDPAGFPSKGLTARAAVSATNDCLLFTAEIPFIKNGTEVEYPSKYPLADFALKANLFPCARICVRGNAGAEETNGAWLSGARESAAKDFLSKAEGSAAQRIFSSGEKPSTAASATAFFYSSVSGGK